MNNLRQAAQQALEALEYIHTETSAYEDELIHAAITALKQALAEPEQEAVISVGSLSKMFESLDGLDRNADGYHWRKGWNDALRMAMNYATAPTPRKPLTEDEIVRLMVGADRVQLLYAKPGDPCYSEFSEGAIRELVESGRAIERAHGIGEQHE